MVWVGACELGGGLEGDGVSEWYGWVRVGVVSGMFGEVCSVFVYHYYQCSLSPLA